MAQGLERGRGWDLSCWKRGVQAPQTDVSKFSPAACMAPLLLINPGLQSGALSHQATRNKGEGNEVNREAQKAALVCPFTYVMLKARKHSNCEAS